MSKLDELFREKLISHSVTPPVAAWQRIEAGLSKQNRPVLWLRWAAVFLLGGLLLSVLLLRREEVPLTVAEKKPLTQPDLKAPTQPDVTSQEPKVKRSAVKKNSPRLQAQPAVIMEENMTREVAAVSQAEPNLTETVSTLAVAEPAKAAPIVLIYTLEPVETAVATADVASSEKRDSSLKRVLEFASTVKNGDSPLDNLRNAKEELFALDFKKKTNSKKH